jgi:hypothetical protein
VKRLSGSYFSLGPKSEENAFLADHDVQGARVGLQCRFSAKDVPESV